MPEFIFKEKQRVCLIASLGLWLDIFCPALHVVKSMILKILKRCACPSLTRSIKLAVLKAQCTAHRLRIKLIVTNGEFCFASHPCLAIN